MVLWAWRTGLVHAPRSSSADQILSDLFVDEDALRVAFAERTSNGLDVGLYTLPLPLADDGTGPARCDDPEAVVLAALSLARGAGTSTTGALAFSAGDGADLPILVCIDAAQVTSAWVALDGELVAAPEDVGSGSSHLEVRRVARGGEGLLEAAVSGKRGASLRVRVLADPARGSGNGSGPGTPDDPGDGGAPGDGGSGGGGDDDEGPRTPPDPADPGGGPGDDDVPGGDADGGNGPTLPGRGGCASGGVDPLAIAGALALLRLRRRAVRA